LDRRIDVAELGLEGVQDGHQRPLFRRQLGRNDARSVKVERPFRLAMAGFGHGIPQALAAHTTPARAAARYTIRYPGATKARRSKRGLTACLAFHPARWWASSWRAAHRSAWAGARRPSCRSAPAPS